MAVVVVRVTDVIEVGHGSTRQRPVRLVRPRRSLLQPNDGDAARRDLVHDGGATQRVRLQLRSTRDSREQQAAVGSLPARELRSRAPRVGVGLNGGGRHVARRHSAAASGGRRSRSGGLMRREENSYYVYVCVCVCVCVCVWVGRSVFTLARCMRE